MSPPKTHTTLIDFLSQVFVWMDSEVVTDKRNLNGYGPKNLL